MLVLLGLQAVEFAGWELPVRLSELTFQFGESVVQFWNYKNT
jgi:hypothetical protein